MLNSNPRQRRPSDSRLTLSLRAGSAHYSIANKRGPEPEPAGVTH